MNSSVTTWMFIGTSLSGVFTRVPPIELLAREFELLELFMRMPGRVLSRTQIIETFERRLQHPPSFEQAECLRNIHRIAEIRLNDRFGQQPLLGQQVWDWAEQLAAWQAAEPVFAVLSGPARR